MRGGGGPRRGGIQRASPARRLRVGLLCAGIALSLIAGRLIQLQGLDGARYRALAERQRLHSISVPAERGSITTADGTILAMTVQTDTVTADPTQITGGTPARTAALRQQVADALAGPLAMPSATILHLLDYPSSRRYVLLAKGISLSAASRVTASLNKLNVVGIYLTPAYTRAYPNGDLAANLVGFTTTTSGGDLRGQAGIEQSYNPLLAGRDGQQEVETGTNGQPIPVATDWVRPMVPGGDVKLTILASLQWEAQQACAQQVKLTRADSCTVVVMRPASGKILAMAQYPGYQPSHVTSLAATQDLPVSAVFPPGSTAKVITAAAALERGHQTPMSPYTVPEQITVGGAYTFHDADPHPTERLTLAGVLAHSSNVGMVQVAQHISPQAQYQYFRAFGIGAPSGLPLPGTSPGLLVPLSKYWGQERYTLAFGQGVSRHRRADGQRLRDHRERRGPGAADHRGGHDVRGRAVRARRAAAPAAGAQAQDRGRAHRHPPAGALARRDPGLRAMGGDPRVFHRRQDRDRAGGQLPVPVRVELHRDGARQQSAARGGGQRPEPEARELLRQRRGRAGVLSRHEVRAADDEDSAGWGQASQRPAHRTVISGSLGPCLRICVQPASRAGRWPNSPNCSA